MIGFTIFHSLLALMLFAVLVLPAWLGWRISKRAGYSGAWALTLIIPILGTAMIWVFAFSRWPVIHKKQQAVTDRFD
jgi:hypothetical protein